jgi:hypothetical protein
MQGYTGRSAVAHAEGDRLPAKAPRGRAREGGAREVTRSRAPQVPSVDSLLLRHQRQVEHRRVEWIEVLPLH